MIGTSNLNQIASTNATTADWSNDNYRITSVLDPLANQDVATKMYVDTNEFVFDPAFTVYCDCTYGGLIETGTMNKPFKTL